MRLLFLLIILLSIVGCENKRDITTNGDLISIRGKWKGIMSVKYPNAEGETVLFRDSIGFTFTDLSYTYYCIRPNIPDTLASGYGTYIIEGNQITFTLEELLKNCPPTGITREHSFRIKNNTLLLLRGESQNFDSYSEESYYIILEKCNIVPY